MHFSLTPTPPDKTSKKYDKIIIGKKYNSKTIGLYRDAGLAAFKNISGPVSEKYKKAITI